MHENVFHCKAANMSRYLVGALKETHEQSELEPSRKDGAGRLVTSA